MRGADLTNADLTNAYLSSTTKFNSTFRFRALFTCPGAVVLTVRVQMRSSRAPTGRIRCCERTSRRTSVPSHRARTRRRAWKRGRVWSVPWSRWEGIGVINSHLSSAVFMPSRAPRRVHPLGGVREARRHATRHVHPPCGNARDECDIGRRPCRRRPARGAPVRRRRNGLPAPRHPLRTGHPVALNAPRAERRCPLRHPRLRHAVWRRPRPHGRTLA